MAQGAAGKRIVQMCIRDSLYPLLNAGNGIPLNRLIRLKIPHGAHGIPVQGKRKDRVDHHSVDRPQGKDRHRIINGRPSFFSVAKVKE